MEARMVAMRLPRSSAMEGGPSARTSSPSLPRPVIATMRSGLPWAMAAMAAVTGMAPICRSPRCSASRTSVLVAITRTVTSRPSSA